MSCEIRSRFALCTFFEPSCPTTKTKKRCALRSVLCALRSALCALLGSRLPRSRLSAASRLASARGSRLAKRRVAYAYAERGPVPPPTTRANASAAQDATCPKTNVRDREQQQVKQYTRVMSDECAPGGRGGKTQTVRTQHAQSTLRSPFLGKDPHIDRTGTLGIWCICAVQSYVYEVYYLQVLALRALATGRESLVASAHSHGERARTTGVRLDLWRRP